MMKHFRLNMALLLMCLIVSVSVAAVLVVKDYWAQGILVMIVGLVCLSLIWHLQSRLIHVMSSFVKALEMNDTTMRVEVSGDSELRAMGESMNRISLLYRDSLRELETRKLYYDRILRIMTHEMRNGITPLIALTADMEKNPDCYVGGDLREAAEMLHTQTEGMRRFLDSYYNLTHLPEPKPETVNAADYFTMLRRLVNGELEQRGLPSDTVTYSVPESMTLEIDPSLLNQVLINLIRNAFDAIAAKYQMPTPSDSGIVSAHFEGRVEVSLTVSEGRPLFTVTDNGGGFSSEAMSNLFQPFFTTKSSGSGVGLSLCRQIMRRHGGDLRVINQPSKGATVLLTI